MRSTLRLLFIFSFAVVGACRARDTPPVAPEAAVQKQLWDARRPADYRVTFSRVCFCVGPRGPVVIEVRGGRITSARYAEGGAAIPSEEWLHLLTVDAVFERIAEGMRNGQPVTAEYHPTLGYPTRAEVGTLANDAGTRYELSDLEPLR
jgi:hypothetical protein